MSQVAKLAIPGPKGLWFVQSIYVIGEMSPKQMQGGLVRGDAGVAERASHELAPCQAPKQMKLKTKSAHLK